MSVILELSMFPMDKGESVSPYVARIINLFENKNVNYQLNPMGTLVETDSLSFALNIIDDAYKELEKDCNRVYIVAKFDIRKGREKGLSKKTASVLTKIKYKAIEQ